MFKHGSLVLTAGTAEITQESTAHHHHLCCRILQHKVSSHTIFSHTILYMLQINALQKVIACSCLPFCHISHEFLSLGNKTLKHRAPVALTSHVGLPFTFT